VEEIRQVIIRNRNRGIIVDANLLLVYVVGYVNPSRLSKFTRTSQFNEQSYARLVELIGNFNLVVTTPNILTEVCNLLGNLQEPERSECLSLIKYFLTEKKESFQEFYVESQTAANEVCFTRLELTDSVISHLAKDKYLVLTVDLELHLHLLSLGIDSINFNNLLV
jgi:hypothetical protein